MCIAAFEYNSKHKMKGADAGSPSLVLPHAWRETTVLKQAQPSALSAPDGLKEMTKPFSIHKGLLSFHFSILNEKSLILPD